MQRRDWIAIIAIAVTVIGIGFGSYVDVRVRLERIESRVDSSLLETVHDHSVAINRLQSQLEAHLVWAQERSKAVQKELDERSGNE